MSLENEHTHVSFGANVIHLTKTRRMLRHALVRYWPKRDKK